MFIEESDLVKKHLQPNSLIYLWISYYFSTQCDQNVTIRNKG